jgi:hypothetical protein
MPWAETVIGATRAAGAAGRTAVVAPSARHAATPSSMSSSSSSSLPKSSCRADRHPQCVATATATRDQEAALEMTAADECLELVAHELRQRATLLLEPRDQPWQLVADDRYRIAARGRTRNVRRWGGAVGQAAARRCRWCAITCAPRSPVFAAQCSATAARCPVWPARGRAAWPEFGPRLATRRYRITPAAGARGHHRERRRVHGCRWDQQMRSHARAAPGTPVEGPAQVVEHQRG